MTEYAISILEKELINLQMNTKDTQLTLEINKFLYSLMQMRITLELRGTFYDSK